MTAPELSAVKEYQHAFKEKFGKTLYIDWMGMNGVEVVNVTNKEENAMTFSSLEALLEYCTEKYGADINILKSRDKRIHFGAALSKEKAALVEFSKIVIKNRLNARKAAEIVNRDRTVIYHFASLTK